MKRIGIAASKIAKGNLFLYNIYVIVFSFLFSVLIFLMAGSSILIAIFILANVIGAFIPLDMEKNWIPITMMCVVTLTIVVVFFNLFAILANVKVNRNKLKL